MLDVSVGVFLRVEIRRIGRQPLKVQFWISFNKGLNLPAAMSAQAVPHQDQRPSEVAAEVPQRHEHIIPVHRMGKVAFEEPAARGERHHRGKLPALADSSQNGRLSPGGPSAGGLAQKGKARLVHKGYLRLEPASFF